MELGKGHFHYSPAGPTQCSLERTSQNSQNWCFGTEDGKMSVPLKGFLDSHKALERIYPGPELLGCGTGGSHLGVPGMRRERSLTLTYHKVLH